MPRTELAVIARCDLSSLWRIETGGRGVSREMLHSLLKALKIDKEQYELLMLAYGFAPYHFQHIAQEKLRCSSVSAVRQ